MERKTCKWKVKTFFFKLFYIWLENPYTFVYVVNFGSLKRQERLATQSDSARWPMRPVDYFYVQTGGLAINYKKSWYELFFDWSNNFPNPKSTEVLIWSLTILIWFFKSKANSCNLGEQSEFDISFLQYPGISLLAT